jgi:prepilin-type N-terminal cleavage/methylation domain-containing protein
MPSIASPSRAPRRCAGMSLIEVMIAFAILAVTLGAAMSGLSSSVQSNAFAEDREKANDLMRRITDRLQTLAWDELMGPTTSWTNRRFAQEANGDFNETGNFAPREEPFLISQAVLDRPSGLADAQIWIEYYRALATRPSNPTVNSNNGLLERWDGASRAYVAIDRGAGFTGPRFDDPTVLVPCRVTSGINQHAGPLVIRVLIRWNLDATVTGVNLRRDGRLSAFLVRMPERDPNQIDLEDLPGLPDPAPVAGPGPGT